MDSMLCKHCKEEVLPQYNFTNAQGDHFCCNGCKSVYEIIHSLGIQDFYELDQSAGISLRNHQSKDYSFLEDEQMLQRLHFKVNYSGNQEFRLHLPSIHCAACVLLLESLPQMLGSGEGVFQARVNYSRKELFVEIDPNRQQLSTVLSYLDGMGYPVSLQSLTQSDQSHRNKTLLNLAVAGFCFGNCMLFSFPEYLAIELSPVFERVFRVLALILATASVLICSKHYFVSAWRSLRVKLLSLHIPIALGISALYFESLRQVLLNTGQGYSDSLTGFLFFLHVGKFLQEQSLHHLSFNQKIKSYFPLSSLKIVEGKKVPTPVEQLEQDDLVFLRTGELISFDGVLTTPYVELDYSFITGESEPVVLKEGDFAQAGGRVINPAACFQVQIPLGKASIQKFWETLDLENEENENQVIDYHTSDWTNAIAKVYTPLVLLVALASCLFWSYQGNFSLALETTVAVLIIACPCAISLSLPFTGTVIQALLRKRGLFLKSIQTLEKMWSVQGLILDKTGTLTESIRELVFEDNFQRTMAPDKGESENEHEILGAIRSLAMHSTHPIAKTVAHNLGDYPLQELEGVKEEIGVGLRGQFRGKEIFLGKDDKLSTSKGMTIIKYEGRSYSISFREKQRKGLKALLCTLPQDFELTLLSGDYTVSNPKLSQLLNSCFQACHFQQNPQDKKARVEEIQEHNGAQLMVGDGLNDAGAMQAAHLSLSVIEDQSSFHPSCDMIVEGNRLHDIANLLNILKGSRRILIACLLFASAYNLIGLSFAVSGHLTPVFCAILMPLSSLSILLISLAGSFLLSLLYPEDQTIN